MNKHMKKSIIYKDKQINNKFITDNSIVILFNDLDKQNIGNEIIDLLLEDFIIYDDYMKNRHSLSLYNHYLYYYNKERNIIYLILYYKEDESIKSFSKNIENIVQTFLFTSYKHKIKNIILYNIFENASIKLNRLITSVKKFSNEKIIIYRKI